VDYRSFGRLKVLVDCLVLGGGECCTNLRDLEGTLENLKNPWECLLVYWIMEQFNYHLAIINGWLMYWIAWWGWLNDCFSPQCCLIRYYLMNLDAKLKESPQYDTKVRLNHKNLEESSKIAANDSTVQTYHDFEILLNELILMFSVILNIWFELNWICFYIWMFCRYFGRCLQSGSSHDAGVQFRGEPVLNARDFSQQHQPRYAIQLAVPSLLARCSPLG